MPKEEKELLPANIDVDNKIAPNENEPVDEHEENSNLQIKINDPFPKLKKDE